MSERDLLQTAYDAWNSQDFGPIWELLDPAVEIDASSHVLNPYVRHGHEGFERMVSEISEAWDQWRLEPEEFVDCGDRIVVAARVHAIGRSSGVQLDQVVYNVWTVRNGKVTRMAFYMDREQALADAAKAEARIES